MEINSVYYDVLKFNLEISTISPPKIPYRDAQALGFEAAAYGKQSRELKGKSHQISVVIKLLVAEL